MSNNQKLTIEASLKRSISQAPGLDFEKLAATPVVKQNEHDFITRPATAEPKPLIRSRFFKPVSAVFASCLILIVCATTWFAEFKAPDSVIALDTNQSVEIVANKHKQILSVRAFNSDVQEMLDDEQLSQTNLEDSVGVIIATMIKNGYLDDSKSVVMVTVENQSTAKADDLALSLNQVIKDSATAENVSATVVRQSVTPDQQAGTEAGQYSVSTGKLNVMKELVTADSSLTLESLAALSLTDLLAVSKEKSVDLTKVIKSDDTVKETKEVVKPATQTVENPVVTPPVSATEAVVESTDKNNDTTKPNDPIVIDTPAPPVVTIGKPVEPEKATEAIDEEKKTQELPKTEEPKNPAEEAEEPVDLIKAI